MKGNGWLKWINWVHIETRQVQYISAWMDYCPLIPLGLVICYSVGISPTCALTHVVYIIARSDHVVISNYVPTTRTTEVPHHHLKHFHIVINNRERKKEKIFKSKEQ